MVRQAGRQAGSQSVSLSVSLSDSPSVSLIELLDEAIYELRAGTTLLLFPAPLLFLDFPYISHLRWTHDKDILYIYTTLVSSFMILEFCIILAVLVPSTADCFRSPLITRRRRPSSASPPPQPRQHVGEAPQQSFLKTLSGQARGSSRPKHLYLARP